MNMKLKRTIAMLLLVCTLVSLLGVGAFATGGESTPETTPQGEGQTTSTLTLSPTFVPPADSAAGEAPATDTGTTCTVTFYDYDTDQTLKTLTKNIGETLTTEDIPTGVAHWLMACGTSELIAKEAGELVGIQINTDHIFYAAYKVTYTDANGNEISKEIVRPGEKPTNVPTKTSDETAIVGWTDKGSEDIVPAETAINADTTFTAKSAPAGDPITLTFYDYDGTELGVVDHKTNQAIPANKVPASKFLKGKAAGAWIMQYTDAKDMAEVYDITTVKPTADASFTAAWVVTYQTPDGTELGKELVRSNGKPMSAPTFANESKTPIAGWLTEEGESIDLDELTVTSDITLIAWARPTLVTDKSVAYVNGSADKNGNVYRFLPDGKLTRAEAAQMLYGLLDASVKSTSGPLNVTFSDVAAPTAGKAPWYSAPIYTMASYGLLNGTGGGKFEPKSDITRAQFVTMIARIYGIKTSTKPCPFTDVSSTKSYYDAVMTAYENGWITGYAQKDGTTTFIPQGKLTRAEAVAILNRVVGRTPTEADKTRIDGYDWRIFIDVDTNWAYYEIMQAATGCGASIPDTGLSAGRHTFALNGVNTYFFVNAEKRFTAVKAGLNKMSDGKSYYFPLNGAGATVYGEGLRILGGKLYLLSSDSSVITEPKSGYDTRVYDYKGHMYYIQTDGSLLRNGYFGQLYFGANGAYTSGDKVLDTWVNNFIDSHSAIGKATTQENKLYQAYVALRDFPAERHGYGSAGYWRYNLKDYTKQEHASLFFERAKGSCEEWGYAMVYLARRIGYKAAGASGKLGGQNNAIHVWEVIEIRGKQYTFDVEQEWGFMYKYYNSKLRTDRDCWKMEYAPGKTIKYGTRFKGTTYGNTYAGYTNIWSPYIYNRSTAGLGF